MSEALKPTWHETRTAGRVRRHTEILRGIAHELSNEPDRQETADEAQARFEAHLDALSSTAPRIGLGAATGAFVDDLIKRYGRYRDHLFKCFDDPRIPATTNGLEGFFGSSKHVLRQALGCGSTTNSVVTNLGPEALVGYHQMQQPGALADILNMSSSPEDFRAARDKIALEEAPGIQQRSMVRNFDHHVDQLRKSWFGRGPPSDANA
jgi:hypothetical protein